MSSREPSSVAPTGGGNGKVVVQDAVQQVVGVRGERGDGERNGRRAHSRISWSLDRTSDVGRATLAAVGRLREAGIDTAQLDASVLLAFVLGVNKAWLYAHPNRALTESEIDRYEELVRRRMVHEPIAYLVGFKPFYGLDISVDRRVLIPRPETELLVERALVFIRELIEDGQRPCVADIGTGSGAIAVALAVNAPEVTVFAVDISEDALAVAAQNVWRYGLGEQVHLLPGHLLDPLPRPVDAIVANLPYVASKEMKALPPQVGDYEPAIALGGGRDGLRIISQLLESLRVGAHDTRLRPGGRLYLEIGASQGPAVTALVERMLPEAKVAIELDYAELPRLAVIAI